MANQQEVVFVKGFGLMRVPAGLSEQDLNSYVSQQLSLPKAPPPPVEEKPKPTPGIMSQAGAFLGSVPEGIASGVGSTVSGIGALTTIDALKKAGAGISQFGQDISGELMSPELRDSTGAQAGRLVGNIATYLTPGIAAKVLGLGGRAALGLSSAVSGASGAGEQLQKIEDARSEGKEVSPLQEYGAAAAAAVGTAALEAVPLARFLEAGAAAPFLRKIPGIGKLLDSEIPAATVKRIETELAGDAPKIAEALALEAVKQKATRTSADIAGRAIKSGLLESPIEGAQTVLQNALARYGYDPEQQLSEGLKESLIAGGIAGTAIQGGIDIFETQRNRKIIRQRQAEAKRTVGEAPLIPESLPQPTLVSRGDEQRFVDTETPKAKADRLNQEAEVAAVGEKAKDILSQGEASNLLLPPGGDTIEYDAVIAGQPTRVRMRADENIEDAIRRIEQSREEARQSNEAARLAMVEAKGREISTGGETPTRLLPAPTPESVVEYEDPELGFISYRANITPAEISQQREQLKQARINMEQSNEAARIAYEKAETAKRTKAVEDVRSVIKQDSKIGNSILAQMGYSSVEDIPTADIPSFLDLVTDGIYERQEQVESASKNIEANFGIASNLARTELRKPIGKLNESQKIELSGLIDTQLEINRQEYQGAQEEADIRTAMNLERSSLEPIDVRRRRASQALYGERFEKIGLPKGNQVADASQEELEQQRERQEAVQRAVRSRSKAASVVTPEEVLERRQFEGQPFTTERYSDILSQLKEASDTPITTSSLRKQFDMPAPEAVSMLSLMKKRGDVVQLDRQIFVEPKAKGPMFDIEEAQPAPESQEVQAQAVKPEPIEPAQFEFNEAIAKKFAPDLVAALKKRNMDDVLLLGIAGSVRDSSGNVRPSRGQYLDRLITISVAPDGNVRSTKDMIQTLDHEIIHAMKELNMFSQNEWNLLTQKFPVSYLGEREERYRKLYADRKNAQQLMKEEAVAKAAADLTQVDPQRLDPVSRSLLGKVKAVLGFGRTAAEMGYSSAEDVLAAIKSGEIGSRAYTPAFEVTPQGKQVSGQRPISIGAPKEIKPFVATPATPATASAPGDKAAPNEKQQKKKRKKKTRVAGQPDVMTGLGDGASEIEDVSVTPGGLSRMFTPPAKEGLIDRVYNFFSVDRRSSFRQKFLDRYDPVRVWALKAYEQTQDPKFIAAASGAYQALLFSDKAQDIAMSGLLNGGFEVTESGRVIAKDDPQNSVIEMFQDLANKPASQPGFANKLEEFAEVAGARRFMDLMKTGRDPGGVISKEQIQKTLDTFSGDDDINSALERYQSFNNQLVDVLVNSGFIDKNMGELWKKAYYIPFYRLPTVKTAEGADIETGEVDAPMVGAKATNLAAAKALTGRNLRVNDFMENIIHNTYYMVGTAMKNVAAQRVVRDGLETGYMKQIQEPKDAEYGTNVINIKNNGVKEYYQVNDPMVYDAVAKSGVPLQDALKVMGVFTQILRRGVTASPSFIIRNSVRDVLQVWMQGGIGSDLTPPIGEWMKGIASVAQNSPEYRALKQAGVAASGIRQQSVADTAKSIRKKIGAGQDEAMSKLFGVFSKSFGALERVSELSEGVSRTQVYKKVLEETGDVDEAVFAAMETINFSRRGNSRGAQIAMALLPFFNARLQGLDVFTRTVFGDKLAEASMGAGSRKVAVRRMAYVAILSVLYAAAMATNKAWLNSTNDERDANIFIPIDWIPGIKEGTVVKFPIPQEMGIITKMLPERLMSWYLGQSDGPEMVEALQRALWGTLSFDPYPQAFRPFLENAANFDYYTRKPIENAYLQRLIPEQRYTEYTSEFYKKIGEEIGYSPVKLDHLVRGYTGTVGAMTADLAGMLFSGGKDVASPERLRFSEPYLLPVIGPLFKSANGKRAVEDLYELDEAANMAATTFRAVSKGQRELSEDKKEELRAMASLDKAIQPTLKRVQALNRLKRTVLASPDLTADQKRDELNDIQERINELAAPLRELKSQIPSRYR